LIDSQVGPPYTATHLPRVRCINEKAQCVSSVTRLCKIMALVFNPFQSILNTLPDICGATTQLGPWPPASLLRFPDNTPRHTHSVGLL